MIFTPELQPALLLRRYKRFLADVQMPNGSEVTVHCPNTGSMKNCITEGGVCWLIKSNNTKRKYAYTWTLATTPSGHLACINTHLANQIVAEAIAEGNITELWGYRSCSAEASLKKLTALGALASSRIDFLLTEGSLPDCYVEVKSVTLLDSDKPNSITQGFFPDAVSQRGQKHLLALIKLVEQGYRAVLLFCVQHTGINSVRAARHIDSRYADLLKEAESVGVQVIAYVARISPLGISLDKAIPVHIE